MAAIGLGLGLGMASMPDLGQQRTLSSRPGSGLVRSTGRPKPRRDHERQHRAAVKRERKNAKRRRHMMACYRWNPCHGHVLPGPVPFAREVSRGE